KGSKALYDVENAFFDEVLGKRRTLPSFLELSDGMLASFAGRYANSDLTAEIRAAPGGLVLAADGDEAFYRPVGARQFQVPDGRTSATGSTFRATAWPGSAAGSPRACRD